MKIVVACDSFKNCLTSKEAAQAIKRGIKKYNEQFQVSTFSTCDGGEGSVDAFVAAKNGVYKYVETIDAFGNPITAKYGLLNEDTAVIEVANIIGLNVDEKRNVMRSSSRGVARVLLDAYNQNVKRIILCLGGSATNDAGVGILEELGAKFYNAKKELLETNSGMLRKIASVDFSNLNLLDGVDIIVASDVKNKLLGTEGCTFCFGKQKGILLSKMDLVDKCMEHYAKIIKQNLNVDLNEFEAGGAAGGIGSALIGFLHAKAKSGIELFLENSEIENKIKDCDLVITGEGQSDYQTKFGKLPVGILKIAQKHSKPVLCMSGALGKDYEELYDLGFVGIVSTADRAMSFSQTLALASEKLEACAYTQIRMIDYFRKNKQEI